MTHGNPRHAQAGPSVRTGWVVAALAVAALGLVPGMGLAQAVDAAPAVAAAVPVPDKGDTTWVMVSAILVTMMTIPGLALFYGGLVRSRNVLSVLMQVLAVFSVMAILWVCVGYSLAFTGAGDALSLIHI